MRTCDVPNCERRHYSRGYCQAHHSRWKRHGDPGPAMITRQPGRKCLVTSCDKPHKSKGYCDSHAYRIKRHGDPQEDIPIKTEPTAQPTYPWMHERLRNTRGPAAKFICVTCARPADEWSYDHNDLKPLIDDQGRNYSTDTTRYSPRCRPCHRRVDQLHAWDGTQPRPLNPTTCALLYRSGMPVTQIARELESSPSSVHRALRFIGAKPSKA